ncbi:MULTISPECIES: CcoQ/FixQ family Cbb3-type cytochrome c oxidase assembly chaperone [Sinorhizobium/Ensifer group]|jgi:cytochrome c oxidase cbb3-type subunit 4|uniref:CcoQ/FixQ family Cbb3-type cytochrome c oxidase assembly chaperone n=1 Tax=Sinorhizobium/Ensifer group TaxID=227292 RepID=UPI00070F8BDD|nr:MULTISPECIES: CcoQ/FixQ family Cbb3-type cytochrome c oxidase assembly chaperone [Sinorhizobium/Ensifer group]KRD53413.1 nitrogen fixation protein FixQ [Ensifer sp. Root278]KSV75328.1 FixQ1 nitrogen fixation protein [Sinorhizobium sp. Sb3]KSV90168.1 FixQ1 nitrogen fixation protein [Sinorhizobium sp. GL28]MBD9506826.1 CcoQ/FixQ family Cbb3-type cytochrome c oxidase assembly chaperone [Ensifer sp. ENS10]WDZ78629.1 CcoQ/FixQ family Cbb3-type cytochrome c oxidase assembly chaperone [Ensifer adh
METYTAMRQFADSWALLAMTLFFLGVVGFIFRPGAKKAADDAAAIPLKED